MVPVKIMFLLIEDKVWFCSEMNGNDSVLPVDSGVGYFQNHMGTDCLMRKMMCPDL